MLPQATSLGPSQAPLRPLDWAHHEASAGSARDGGAAFDTLSTDGGASAPGWQAGHLPPYAHSTPVVSQGEHGSAGDDKGSDGIAVRRGNIESLLHAQRMALASSYPSSRGGGLSLPSTLRLPTCVARRPLFVVRARPCFGPSRLECAHNEYPAHRGRAPDHRGDSRPEAADRISGHFAEVSQSCFAEAKVAGPGPTRGCLGSTSTSTDGRIRAGYA